MAPFAALAAVILVPLVFTSEGLLATATAQRQASAIVGEWLGDTSDLEVTSIDVSEDQVTVKLSGPSDPPPLEALQQDLIEQLERPVGLTVTTVPAAVQQRDAPDEEPSVG